MQIQFIIYFTILLAAITSGLYRKKKLSASSKVLLLLIVLTFLVEVMAYFSKRTLRHNLYIYHIFIPVEFFLVSLVYYTELRARYFIYIGLSIFVFSFLNALFFQQFLVAFPSYTSLLTSFFTVLWTLIFFKTLLENSVEKSFTAYPLFWVSCGWLFFDVVNLFSFGSFAFLHKNASREFITVISILRYTTNYLLYLMFSIAFWSQQEKITLPE